METERSQQQTRRVVVLSAADLAPSLVSAVEEVIAGQVGDMDVELHFGRGPGREQLLYVHLDAVLEQMEAEQAMAGFWVSADPQGNLHLYLVEEGARQVLVRRIDATQASGAAAAEAIGVIARRSTAALLAGKHIGMEAVDIDRTRLDTREGSDAADEVEPELSEQPARKRKRGIARLGLAYRGNSYSEAVAWQHGLALTAAWVAKVGVQFGVGYTFVTAARPQSEVVQLSVRRHPVELFLGYRFSPRKAAIDVELAGTFDPVTRDVSATTASWATTQGSVAPGFALTPRLRGGFVPIERLEVFALAGVEVWLTNREYTASEGGSGDPVVILRPHRIRATVGAGIALRL